VLFTAPSFHSASQAFSWTRRRQKCSTDNFGSSEDYALTLGWRIGPGGIIRLRPFRRRPGSPGTAKLSGAKLEDAITREVVEGYTRVNSLLDQLGTARQTLQTASETLRLTRERKQFGVGAVLEDIQAQQDLTAPVPTI